MKRPTPNPPAPLNPGIFSLAGTVSDLDRQSLGKRIARKEGKEA